MKIKSRQKYEKQKKAKVALTDWFVKLNENLPDWLKVVN